MSDEMEYGSGGFVLAFEGRGIAHKALPAPSVDADHTALEGYATIYGDLHWHNGHLEYLAKGCFGEASRSDVNVGFFMEHDPERVLGSKFRGSLEIGDDGHGVAFRLKVPPTAEGRQLIAEAKADAIRMSIGFNVKSSVWKDIEGERCRIVHRADLVEVSAVRNPAIPATWLRVIDLRKALPFGATLAEGKMRKASHEMQMERSQAATRRAGDRLEAARRALMKAVA